VTSNAIPCASPAAVSQPPGLVRHAPRRRSPDGVQPARPVVEALAHHRAPFVELLERYQELGTVPFSCAGHKLGSGADPALVGLLGAELFAADVWLDTSTRDQTLRAALPRQRLLERQPRLPARRPQPGR
jgi:hypothetical protein